MAGVARGDRRIAVPLSASSKWGVGGISKNWLEVGEAKLVTAVFSEDNKIGKTDALWSAKSCLSLNVKHDEETGVGRESGVMGSVRSVLKGQYSVGGTMIRSGVSFLVR